jgi:hypothetical protein
MTNHLPLIFGLSSLLLGIYLFLVFFGIYKPKTSEETEEKSENMKLIMKVISIILILKGCYNLLNLDSDTYKINSAKVETEWNVTAKDSLNKYCLIGMGNQPEKYSEINLEYCNCTTEKIMGNYTQEEYETLIKKPVEEQMKIFTKLLKDCKTELQKKIDVIEKPNK